MQAEVFADGRGWVLASGKLLPQIENMKSVDGFGVWLFATADPKWKQKWESPDTPHIDESREVAEGGRLVILVFFTNPLPDTSGNVNITGDFKLTRPDGSTFEYTADAACMTRALVGDRVVMRRCPTYLVGEPTAGDPKGQWLASVVLRDKNRNVEIPVQLTYKVR